ncbi:MAG: NAD-dependent epimerase/dehydratase family protein [Candidatus Binatia bacterium]
MKIVVTGGAGFIGSHVADAYIAAGHEVFVIDDLSSGDKRNLNPKAKFHHLDLLDAKMSALIAEIRPDVLCHHAAQMDVRRSVSDPIFDARVNILGFINLLEAGKQSGLKKVVFASSGGAIYGEQEKFPAAENHPTRPASPYGVSKLTGENYLAYYHATFNIPYVALRYANVYGPRQNFKGEAGVVAIFIDQLLAGKTPTINGDGKQTRDFVYVGDVAAANLLALDASHVGGINIGTGVETDLLTLYDKICRQTNSNVAAAHGPAKEGEQRRSSLDCTGARKIFGWSPKTPLDDGLGHTVAYYRKVRSA